jgi:DNA-binding transcriptional regulator YiaG
MKKKELKDLEFIANGVLIENESIERMESDRRKRLLAASFVAVRNMTGMNRKEFAEWLAIPYRTMQDWELGTSQVPEYVLRLVAYKVLMEKEREIYNADTKVYSAVPD